MLAADVSKYWLTCAHVDPSTRQLLFRERISNDEAGIRPMLEKTPPDCPLVLEPTGRYSLTAVRVWRAAGRPVRMAPPKRAKSFLQSIQDRCKSDEKDSYGLALFGLSQTLPAYPVKSEKVERLDQLLSARRGLTLSITSLQQRLGELPYAKEALREAVTALKQQQKALDKQIGELTRRKDGFPEAARLQAVPGIGPLTAAAVASRLVSRGFTHSDQFVAFIGFDVKQIQSGKRKGQLGLTKQGEAELRRLLFNCARAAVMSKNSPFKTLFERERAKGLSKTAAYCSVARKLSRLCWSLVHHNSTYDPARVFTKPDKKEASREVPIRPSWPRG